MKSFTAIITTSLAVIAVLTLLSTPRANGASEPIVVKFSHVVANDTPKGKAALKFKELAEQATGGRVKIEIYPNSTLYKDKEELEALQLGQVQMLAPAVSKFGPLGVREFEVFDLPYLFDGYAELHTVTQGAVGKWLFKKLEPRGVTGLAYWDNGFKVISANKSVRLPADFKGLKLRIQASKVLDAQMRALGAIPQVMAFSEVYQALQMGVVDATENPPSNFYTQKMQEVQRYVTVSNHGYLGYAVVVNKLFWDGLPPIIRGQLEEALKTTTDYANLIAKQENDAALEAVRQSGRCEVYWLTEAEKREWKRVLIPVHRGQENRIGKELIDMCYAATGFDPERL